VDEQRLILVVEDDEVTRAFLLDNLAADGFKVAGASGAGEGLRAIEVRQPALVVLDLLLDDGSGLALLDRVRAADGLSSRIDPELPVIVLTGRSGEADRVRSFARGADDHLNKPTCRFPQRVIPARAAMVLRLIAGRADLGPRLALVGRYVRSSAAWRGFSVGQGNGGGGGPLPLAAMTLTDGSRQALIGSAGPAPWAVNRGGCAAGAATRRYRERDRRLPRAYDWSRLTLPARNKADMDFRILGPLGVLDEGRAVALGGSKQRALLALLLLHANETLTTDRLIDELWGQGQPATPAKTVQMQVSRLRKALGAGGGGGLVVTRAHGYELRLDPERLDAHLFERLIAEGKAELAAGRPQRAASALERALTLWRGPPLADLAYEPFAQSEIARLDDLRVAGVEQLIEAKLALGAHAEVIAQLEALIAGHPYRERLRAQLMLALYRCDRQADALQAYQDARRTLVEELGIEPGERLRELERAILAQDPGLQPLEEEQQEEEREHEEAPEPAVEIPPSKFVGRERELAELLTGLNDAFAGRGRLFLLSGQPGIGKSRLAKELIAHATTRDARILVGRCWEAGGAPAYWPWVQSLSAYARETDPAALRAQLGAGGADLAQIVPELRERFPDLPEPPALEPEAARFRLFDATAAFLRNASTSRPIVLVLDDLHAADAPSLLLLRFLARQLGSARMLLLGAYRDVDPLPAQPLTEMLAELAREPVTGRLPLGGLSEREVAEYIDRTVSEPASPQLAVALYEETEGNPLFVGEMVRLLSAEGARSDALVIPQSVRDVIARRLSHLSDEGNRVLVLASVLGREFLLDALGRLAGIGEDELLDVLDEPMAARVVCDVPGTSGRLRFAHVLIRDTLYEGLTTARRVRLHRRAVEGLEALYGEEPGPYLAELAYHCMAGRDLDKGLRYAWRAGDRAVELLAYEEAARLYEMGLQALEPQPSVEPSRCRLLLALGEAQARAGLMDRAREAFLGAADVARSLNLTDELARAALGYGGRFTYARAGADRRLVLLLEEALAALPDADGETRATLLARLAGALRGESSTKRRATLSREALQIARGLGNPTTLAYALEGAFAGVSPDDTEAWLAIGNELVRVAREAGDREREFFGHQHGLGALMVMGDIRAVDTRLEAMARLADELRQPTQQRALAVTCTMRALFDGRLDEAEQLIQEALQVGPGGQGLDPVWFWVVRVQAWALAREQGRLHELRPDIEQLVDDHPTVTCLHAVLASVYSELGSEADAREQFDALARHGFAELPFDSEWLFQVSLLSEVSVFLGDARSATKLYELLLPYAGCNVLAYPEISLGSASRYLGLLASALSRWADAEGHFQAAIEMNAQMGGWPWVSHTQQDYAGMLLARGESSGSQRALELIAEAHTGYRELRMESWAQRASELERALQVSPAADGQSDHRR
jgi:DNA-binding SARP family transcriptional activator